jgi:uroporphyrinogen decarboxylase
MRLTNTLINKDSSCVPIWFMRQAGRYLPEFRKIRSSNKDFIKLCLNSELSSEITLQPLLRFNLDAAIIFSDILMVPFGLGQEVNFIKNKGPVLSELNIDNFLNNSEINFSKKLSPVYKAIKETRKKLNKEKSLISFIGSPWTLIIYMLGLKKAKDVLDQNLLRAKQKEVRLILEKITLFLCAHIKNQVEAGADVVQIFDSWAGLIPKDRLDEYCIQPNLKIVNFCKDMNVPTICFPRGIKDNYVNFVNLVKPDGINIDYEVEPEWARKNLGGICIQGGMKPQVLLQDNKKIFKEAERFLKVFQDYPYIFNLGHGLLPETDPNRVEKLINYIKDFK